MKPEHLLKFIDETPYGWVAAGIVLGLTLCILSPFVWDSFKGKKSA